MKKNTKTILSGATALAVIVGGYFLYSYISKQAMRKKIALAEQEMLDEQAELPPEMQETADTYNPASHVKQIGEMLEGWNVFAYNDEVNSIIIPLSDDRTRKLALAYRQKYNVSLYWRMMNESASWFAGLYDESEGKLKRLGLTQ
jgi:hypothetical protein